MKILALIPARGGSKRLPGKNIRVLGGKPLIAWSIELASAIPAICATLVSTDDPSIAEVSRRAGALVPWLRPAALSTDTASSVDVVLHALDWYEAQHGSVDGVLLLQPTSPFRSCASVLRGIAAFEAGGGQSVVGVSPCQDHPMWSMRLEGAQLRPFMDGAGLGMRSQDLPPAYVVNGSFYLITPSRLRAERAFIGEATNALVIDSPQEALDIDTAWDWALAEAVLTQGDVTN
ncbi:MAG: acylneuraminate cytidylyltransferase family protein [Pseudomonadota bacterium]